VIDPWKLIAATDQGVFVGNVPLGVREASINNPELHFAQNPAREKIDISWVDQSKAELSITNVLGVQLCSAIPQSGRFSYDLSSLLSSVYFVTLRFADGSVLSGKFLKAP
jgi:hypothetical protein